MYNIKTMFFNPDLQKNAISAFDSKSESDKVVRFVYDETSFFVAEEGDLKEVDSNQNLHKFTHKGKTLIIFR